MQRWPYDGDLVNKYIPNYGWMKKAFGAPPRGRRPSPTCISVAETIKRAIGEDNSDDDFMPLSKGKRVESSKGKSVGSSKGKTARSSKAVAAEDSDDDFM